MDPGLKIAGVTDLGMIEPFRNDEPEGISLPPGRVTKGVSPLLLLTISLLSSIFTHERRNYVRVFNHFSNQNKALA